MNDDHAALTRLLPDPARHNLSEERHQVLRDRFMQQLDDPQPTTRSTAGAAAPRVRRRRRWLLVPATAAALVVVLWAVVAVGFGVGKFWSGRTEAGGLLERIALVASSSNDVPPADQVRDDQFEFVETYGGFAGLQVGVDADGRTTTKTSPITPHRRQIWKSVNGTQPGLLRDAEGASNDDTLEAAGAGYLNNPTFRYLTTLPTNPDALLAKIYLETWGAGPTPQQEAFVTIGDLMRESVVPPKLAAALYKAAARIPGIAVVEDAVDALGRHGIAIARTHAGERTEWIFDRNTLQFLGERSVTTEQGDWGPAGTVIGSTAIVARTIVDRPGQLPA